MFYKLWAYSNPLVAAYDARQRQLCPMVIVAAPQAWDPATRSPVGPGLWLAIGIMGLLAALWAAPCGRPTDRIGRRARQIPLPPLDLD